MYKIYKKSEFLFVIKKQGKMNVPVKIFTSEKMLKKLKDDKSIEQGINVASLPGIVNSSIMMPDAHQGYGFSIGGVAAFDLKNGIITPGGIGFDINCGVRLLQTNLTREEILPKIQKILDELFDCIPAGVGKESKIKLSYAELNKVLKDGANWAKEHGYGTDEDLELCEEQGCMNAADPNFVSDKAKARGKNQLGTLGSGNHFLELQYVDEIYDPTTAKIMGIEKKNQILIMIHCGSRGLGHQVCSDYLRKMENNFPDIMSSLPEKDLIYAPFSSNLAQEYYKAMASAANFAWTNRQIIAHHAKESFIKVFPQAEIHQIYDVAHNIAKIEDHIVNGIRKKLIVHRKGATRAFGKENNDIPRKYYNIGQPVLIPGSMGTASYILIGTEDAMNSSFGSSAHGAGRRMSRIKAIKNFQANEVVDKLNKNNITIKSATKKGISEEAPEAYKDIDEVIKITKDANLSKPIVKLRPLGVIKG